jgi:hypothetical protein
MDKSFVVTMAGTLVGGLVGFVLLLALRAVESVGDMTGTIIACACIFAGQAIARSVFGAGGK